MSSLPSLCVVVPLIAAAALAGTTGVARPGLANVAAAATAAAVAAMALVLLARSGQQATVAWMGGWTPRHGIAVGIALVADGAAAGLVALTAVLAVVAVVVATRLPDTGGHLLQALVLLFLAGMAGFALAGDIFTAFVFFELTSVAAYALAGLFGDRRSPVEGALQFAVSNTAGSVLLLTGIALLYGRSGALNLAQLGVALPPGDATVAVGFALVATGFLVKAAMVPFHFWLADAYTAAPIAVCVLLAGAMSEMGAYGLARTYWTAFAGPLGGHADALRAILLALGTVTVLVGGAMCLAQRVLKRMLAFATISHLGVLVIAVAMLRPDSLAGAAAYAIGDGCVRAGLFVAIGAVAARYGTGEEGALFGRGRDAPWLGVLVAAGGLALAGAPPFGPFLGRALVEDDAIRAGLGWVPAVLVASGLLTGGAVLRVVRTVFLGLGRPPGRERVESADEGELPSRLGGVAGPALMLPATALILAGLAWGVVPGLGARLAALGAAFADPAAYAGAVLHGAHRAVPRVAGHAPELLAYGLGAAATLGALAIAAAGAALPERRTPRWVLALRRVHSGRTGDALAWLAAGASAVASACLLALT
jgi:multicomponent Na+:H+ antiporter subunit D